MSLLGIQMDKKGYKIYNLESKRIYVSWNIQFFEKVVSFVGLNQFNISDGKLNDTKFAIENFGLSKSGVSPSYDDCSVASTLTSTNTFQESKPIISTLSQS